jgi:hypothetical protein
MMEKQNQQFPLFKAGLELQNILNDLGMKFCFIGGLAVLRWGELRMTQDIDVTLLCGFGFEQKLASRILEQFQSRLPDAEKFAQQNRILLLKASNDVSIDVSLSGLPFEEEMIERATFFEFATDFSLLTCSVEDLIILKAFADRPKDWMDVEGIIVRQKDKLNRSFILEQLAPLCAAKDSSTIIPKLGKLLS